MRKRGDYWPCYLPQQCSLVALGASIASGMPGGVRGTLIQSAFRGNLADIVWAQTP